MSNWFRKHRHEYPDDWDQIATRIKAAADWRCAACGRASGPGHILTVHHINGIPGDVRDENLASLCQVCHLRAHGLRPKPQTKQETIARLAARFEMGYP